MLSRIVKRKAENMRNKRLRLIAALLLGAVVVVQPAALTLRA
jgi:hypothetical protein